MPVEKRVPLRAWVPMRPPRDLEEIRQRFEDDVARPFIRSVWEHLPEQVKGWTPSIDVYEKGDSFVVKVEIPGMKQEDIDLTIVGDTLNIKGERKPESGVSDADYVRAEIAYGSFFRRIALPSGMDDKKIDAIYEGGILYITLQRVAGAKPKKINVHVKKESV